ncbi:MAG: hypothetical protein KGI54_10615 [Pseudomonadota bacterium]|nr:hypothetical protein [Pseudomonadota bacterium]
MSKELEELEYNDVIVNFVSAMNQRGARRVLNDLQTYYPAFFEEMRVQINRFPDKPVAALLKK